jgi:hypothetical protein
VVAHPPLPHNQRFLEILEELIKELYLALIAHGHRMQGFLCYLAPTLLCSMDLPDIGAAKREELNDVLDGLNW